jgi:HKD family nuclease
MTCPFCAVDPARVAFEDELVLALWDGFPVSAGHLLVVPKSHAATWEDLTALQKTAIWAAIDRAVVLIRERHGPDGFNVGFNQGAAAGQTVFHFHLHVIPRYGGDVQDPRGGVRHVIPTKANYLIGTKGPERDELSRRLVTGDTDHLLPHLRLHLDQATRCDFAVAFLMDSGARLIVEHLRDFLSRGGKARILVGDYLQVTEPVALRRLNDLSGDLDLRVYETREQGFHLKTYIFLFDSEGIAFVGSSNLSESALTDAIEWNYRVVSNHDEGGFQEITTGFESLFTSYSTVKANESWIRLYEQRRHRPDWQQAGLAEEPRLRSPFPMHSSRKPLRRSRPRGRRASRQDWWFSPRDLARRGSPPSTVIAGHSAACCSWHIERRSSTRPSKPSGALCRPRPSVGSMPRIEARMPTSSSRPSRRWAECSTSRPSSRTPSTT